MSKTIVAVHKANIPLLKGESVHQFTNELSKAGREHVMKKLNMTEKSGNGAWMAEAFSGSVIFSTYKSDEPSTYYACAYKRDEKGAFDFGSLVEVQRMTVFKPKEATVTKSLNEKPEEVEVDKRLERFGDWIQTEKSFWGGVL